MPPSARKPSAPERKPSQRDADAPPPDPDAAPTKPAPGSVLFHALLEAGFDAVVAYTVEKHIKVMASETAAAHTQPLVVEIRAMRAEMATKADLANFATKADLEKRMSALTRWMFGAMLAQAALIVALLKLPS